MYGYFILVHFILVYFIYLILFVQFNSVTEA